MRKILIDTDTASDDAVALMMALRHPNIDIQAITVVAGNVPTKQGVQNALYTVELCGKNVPVYAGLAKPLVVELHTAQETHGDDGMGDIGLELSGRQPAEGHGVQVILDTVNAHAGDIDLVTLGPLTNVAVALTMDPTLTSKINHCYIMGGTSDNFGNVTAVAEYNIWADPESARIVFESGMQITMIGWDISRKYAVFEEDDVAAIKAFNTPLADFTVDIQGTVFEMVTTELGLTGFDFPDPIAMAVALDNAVIAESDTYAVTVDTSTGPSRGQTLIDHSHRSGERNTRVVTVANRQRFIELLHASVQ